MIELDKVFAVLEILRYEGEALVVEGILSRILVLVEGVEMSRREALKDGTRVAAAAGLMLRPSMHFSNITGL